MTCFPKGHGGLQPCLGTQAARWLRCLGLVHAIASGLCVRERQHCLLEDVSGSHWQRKLPLARNQHLCSQGITSPCEYLKLEEVARPSIRSYLHSTGAGPNPAAGLVHMVTSLCSAFTCRHTAGEVCLCLCSRGIATLQTLTECAIDILASGQQWHLASAVSAVLLVTSLLFPQHSAATELATPSPGWHVLVSSYVKIQI